jgi:hypothetical protein
VKTDGDGRDYALAFIFRRYLFGDSTREERLMRKQKKAIPTWEEIAEQVAYFVKHRGISLDEIERMKTRQGKQEMTERIQALWATRDERED